MIWSDDDQPGPSMQSPALGQSTTAGAASHSSADLAPSVYMQQLDRALSLDGLFNQLDSINTSFSDMAPNNLSKPQKRTAKSRLYNMSKIKNNRRWLRDLFLDHSDDSTDWSEYEDEEFSSTKTSSKPKKTPAEKAAADDKEIREMLRMHRFMKKLSNSNRKKQAKSPVDYAALDGMSMNYLSLPTNPTSVTKRSQIELPIAESDKKPTPKRRRNRNKKKISPTEFKDSPAESSESVIAKNDMIELESFATAAASEPLDFDSKDQQEPSVNKSEDGLFDEITYDTTLPDEFLEGLGLVAPKYTTDSNCLETQAAHTESFKDRNQILLKPSDIDQVLGTPIDGGLVPQNNLGLAQNPIQTQQLPIVTQQSQITNVIDVTNNPSALPAQIKSLNLPPGLVMSQTSSSSGQTTVSFPAITHMGQQVTVNMIQNLQQKQEQTNEQNQIELKRMMKKKKKLRQQQLELELESIPEKPKVKIPSVAERRKNIWLLIGKIEIPKAITRRNIYLARRDEHTSRLAEMCLEAHKTFHCRPSENELISVSMTTSITGQTICPTWSSLSSSMKAPEDLQPSNPINQSSDSLEIISVDPNKENPSISRPLPPQPIQPPQLPPPPPPPPAIIQLPIVLTQVTTIPEIDLPATGPDTLKSITLTPTMEVSEQCSTTTSTSATTSVTSSSSSACNITPDVEIIPLGNNSSRQ